MMQSMVSQRVGHNLRLNSNINAFKNNLCLHVFFSNLCFVYRVLLGNMLDACCCPPSPAKKIYFGGGVKYA